MEMGRRERGISEHYWEVQTSNMPATFTSHNPHGPHLKLQCPQCGMKYIINHMSHKVLEHKREERAGRKRKCGHSWGGGARSEEASGPLR